MRFPPGPSLPPGRGHPVVGLAAERARRTLTAADEPDTPFLVQPHDLPPEAAHDAPHAQVGHRTRRAQLKRGGQVHVPGQAGIRFRSIRFDSIRKNTHTHTRHNPKPGV